MTTKRCIHVLATPGFEPEMCGITLPNIKAYADKIHADFNIISERKLSDWPIVCEKQQIYELGRSYDWNIYVDADMLIHPKMDDLTMWHPQTNVGNWWFYKASEAFDTTRTPYFAKDKRDYGIVDCFVVTTKHTHHLWEPLPGQFKDYKNCIRGNNYWRTNEYCLSHNFAKHSFQVSGILRNQDHLYHISTTSNRVNNSAQRAADKLKYWLNS